MKRMCAIAGCDHKGRGGTGRVCEMHYYRMRRTGSYDLVPAILPLRLKQSAGYVRILAPGHPMSDSSNNMRAYEHRVVYYDAHGEGPFNCHWCGVGITWASLHIDHLDDNKENNVDGNLVASCPKCNQQRGKHKMIAKNSAWVEFNGEFRTVKEWAKKLGVSHSTMWRRLKGSWTRDRALSEPKGPTGPKVRVKDLYDELRA